METAISRDGTPIAYSRAGNGPALVFVDGALCYRASGPSGPLAARLASHFTVFTYDRRGRGESGNTAPFAVEREIEDLGAVISAAGGSAFVYGVSSGAVLALEAAHSGLPITRLALYEPPFIVDGSREPIPQDFFARLTTVLEQQRRGDAVKSFMKLVQVPAVFIIMMRVMPAWSKLTAVAHTLPYDITLVKDYQLGKPLPRFRWAGATSPTLVMDGGKSPAWLRNAARALTDVLPNASHRTLPGQTHMINAEAHMSPLVEFFRDSDVAQTTAASSLSRRD
jgi:pimeloyl-ACP methyl ester carboxylesterase